MRLLLRFPAVLATLLAFALPGHAFAFQLSNDWATQLCRVIPCGGVGMGNGAAGLNAYLVAKVMPALQTGFVAAAVFMVFTAARWLVMYPTDEGVVKEARTSFIYIICGCIVVGLAQWFVIAFSPAETGANLINTGVVTQAISNIIVYFRLVLATVLTANIVIQSFRLITSQGEQDQIDKARKRLVGGFIGVAVVLLANVITVSVNPQLSDGTNQLALEIAGLANYFVTIVGFLAVVVILVAGVLLVISVDESLKDKAKTMIKVAVAAIVFVVISYALVTAFIAF